MKFNENTKIFFMMEPKLFNMTPSQTYSGMCLYFWTSFIDSMASDDKVDH